MKNHSLPPFKKRFIVNVYYKKRLQLVSFFSYFASNRVRRSLNIFCVRKIYPILPLPRIMSSSNDDPPAKRTRSALKTLKRPSPMPSSAPTNENDNKHLHDEIERLTEELIEEKRANMKIFETSLKISNAVQGILEMTVSVTLQAAKDLDQRLNNIERKMDMAARMEESIRNESIQKDVEKKIEETLAKERENTAFYRGKMCELMKQMQVLLEASTVQ